MEPVITEGEIRTVETVTNRVVTNKTVVQRTTSTNETHVNKYDADGNLKSSQVDSESFVERETVQTSEPTASGTLALGEDASTPPTAVTGSDQLSLEKFLTDGEQLASSEQGATLVMSTTDLVPGASWSGTTVEQSESNIVPAEAPSDGSATTVPEVQTSQRTTTNVAGESWSRSGEAVWITEAPKNSPASPSTASTVATVSLANGDATPSKLNGTSGSSQPVAPDPEQPPALSNDERRRKRCLENRARKAAAAGASN